MPPNAAHSHTYPRDVLPVGLAEFDIGLKLKLVLDRLPSPDSKRA